jgi:hypothetical protein
VKLLDVLSAAKQALKRQFYWIILFTSIGGAVAYYNASKIKTRYKSYSKIFPMGADGGGSIAGGLGEQLGLTTGGGGAGKYYNVAELVNSRNLSRTIVNQAAIATDPSRPLYLAIIEDYNRGQSSKSKQINISKEAAENITNAADVLKKNTMVTVEKSDFTKIECYAYNDSLALRLNECILSALSDYYIQTKTEKARFDLSKIGTLRDSLKDALNLVEKALLDFAQRTKYLTDSTVLMPRIKLDRLRSELADQYNSATMSHQNANFMLLSQSPIFQILDKPTGPVNVEPAPIKQQTIAGLVIGFVLGFIVAIRKVLGRVIVDELKAI